ncbi:MAG: hypothetical protein WCW78_00250 [Candidatus Paceibacterota bacterium]|jgi:Na+/phosphate symporter
MGFLPASARPHIAMLMTALAFLIAQFIGELLIVYIITQLFPDAGTFLYASKQIVVFFHLLLTLVLVLYAKPVSKRFYKES